jgi:transposase-like protein
MALPKVYSTTGAQRCWVHKAVNVLDKMSKRVQGGAKAKLHRIWMGPTREDAHADSRSNTGHGAE